MIVFAKDCPVLDVGAGVSRQILAHDPQLMMVRVVFKKGAVGYVHSHPHRQVTYVESGRFDVTMGDTRQSAGPGRQLLRAAGRPARRGGPRRRRAH